MAISAEPDVSVKIFSDRPIKYGHIVCSVLPNGTSMAERDDTKAGKIGITPSGAYLAYDIRYDDPTYYDA